VLPVTWQDRERPARLAQERGVDTPAAGEAGPGSSRTRFTVHDTVVGGWRLVAFDADARRLLANEPTDVRLYWAPPSGAQLSPDPDFFLDVAGRWWLQTVRGARSRLEGGTFDGARPGAPSGAGTAEAGRLAPSVPASRDGRETAVVALAGSTSAPNSSLTSPPLPVTPGRLYLQAGWLRGDGARAGMGWQWQPSLAHGSVAAGIGPADWQYHSRLTAAPPDARETRLWLLNQAGPTPAYFDGLVFVELGALAPPCAADAEGAPRTCGPPLVPLQQLGPDHVGATLAPQNRVPGSWQPGNPALAAWLDAARRGWQPTTWLPRFLDQRLATLAEIREGSRTGYAHAASNVDVRIGFANALDLFSYLPRAAQIGFLAPFPHQWFERGSLEVSALQRRIAAGEMLGVYLALAGLLAAVWRWWRRAELWVLLWLSASTIVVFSTAIANVGTLYRMRYGYLMLLVALGIAGALAAWQGWRARRRAAHAAPDLDTSYRPL
jgi:hypothetical protein